MDGRKVTVDSSLPAALSFVFGWILIGPMSHSVTHPYQALLVSLTVSLEGLVERFWQVEEPEEARVIFTDEGRCE